MSFMTFGDLLDIFTDGPVELKFTIFKGWINIVSKVSEYDEASDKLVSRTRKRFSLPVKPMDFGNNPADESKIMFVFGPHMDAIESKVLSMAEFADRSAPLTIFYDFGYGDEFKYLPIEYNQVQIKIMIGSIESHSNLSFASVAALETESGFKFSVERMAA